ncbi:MAG TPA: hypothetical protein PKE00_13505 [Planctomycetota bacterium]|nr:hypothetical protein [Planctomycetota bacterium]
MLQHQHARRYASALLAFLAACGAPAPDVRFSDAATLEAALRGQTTLVNSWALW